LFLWNLSCEVGYWQTSANDRQLGSAAKGKLANRLLLDANPLENISNTKKIYAVIVNGRLLQRADLDKLLEDAKKQASNGY
jgi:hypothetical protein